MEKKNPWKTINSKVVYDTNWIKVTEHEVINPGGHPGIYSTTHFKHLAIGIIPLEDDGTTWMVGQYRYPINEYCWEIPEGGGEAKESPLEAAKRELSEECGLTAGKWQEILRMHLSNSATDELAIIFLARGLSKHDAHPEDDEELALRRLPFDQLFSEVMANRHTDSLTVAGVLKLKCMMNEGLIQKYKG